MRTSEDERKEGEKSVEKGEKSKRENVFARKNEVKSVMFVRPQLVVLTDNDAYFSTNNLNPSLPGVVMFIL